MALRFGWVCRAMVEETKRGAVDLVMGEGGR